jgi:hypothetical protein
MLVLSTEEAALVEAERLDYERKYGPKPGCPGNATGANPAAIADAGDDALSDEQAREVARAIIAAGAKARSREPLPFTPPPQASGAVNVTAEQILAAGKKRRNEI